MSVRPSRVQRPAFDSRLSSGCRSPQPWHSSVGRVRGRRAVERELLAGDAAEPLELLLPVGGDDERRAHHLHVGAGPARRGEAHVRARAG